MDLIRPKVIFPHSIPLSKAVTYSSTLDGVSSTTSDIFMDVLAWMIESEEILSDLSDHV